MAAREARQDFFRRALAHCRLDAIATGHQADDVAETLLLRLMRGSGAAGLSGLRPRSELPPTDASEGRPLVIVRPFLPIRREELRDWLRERGLCWCEDPSNENEAIPRNEVRRSILPALTGRARGEGDVIRQLSQSADILREEDAYLEDVALAWLSTMPDGEGLPVSRLKAEQPLAIRRRVVRAWLLARLGAMAAGFDCVGTVLGMEEGAIATLPGGLRVACSGGCVRLMPEEPPVSAPPESVLHVPGATKWGEYTIETAFGGILVKERGSLDSWPARCTISAEHVAGRPLTVRGRRPGDRFSPLGLGGGKKLQDIFTDGKLPEPRRDAYPVIVCGGEIAWVPGYRVAAPFAVRDGAGCLQIVVKRAT